MRHLVLAMALICLFPGVAARASEAVNVVGRATGVFQYPKTNTICLAFETKDQKRFLVCDDITAKEVIESLFALGKKDAECRLEGTVAKKSGEDVYLRVTRVGQEAK
jgi:hypothetical protein